MPDNVDRRKPEHEKSIKRVALKQTILYKSRNCIKKLFLGLHVLADKLVMVMKIKIAALQKMIRWWITFFMKEQSARQSEEMILDVIGGVRILREDDDQTCHRRTTLRSRRNIPAVNDEQSIDKNMVASNSEDSIREPASLKLAT